MARELKPHEIETEIDERVTGKTADYWAGASREMRDEYVILAQREGIDASVRLLDDMAKPDEGAIESAQDG